jgi:hypothetical protein
VQRHGGLNTKVSRERQAWDGMHTAGKYASKRRHGGASESGRNDQIIYFLAQTT